MSDHEPSEEQEPLPIEWKRYWQHRRGTAHALIGFVVAAVAAVVFQTPRAWGSGEIANVIQKAAWVGVVIFGVVAYIRNAKMAECRGYCRGKLGVTPAEIGEGDEPGPV